jgi:predicted TPR repeat methyltransferase
MLDGLGYASPRLLVEAFVMHAGPASVATVLDLGCGTGLVGAELAAHGYRMIDGVDLSPAMLQVAARRGIYRRLIEADLTRSLPLADAQYTAAVCAGTFTSGHVDASCLDEVMRVIETGGVLACTVHHAVWEPLGFAAAFERFTVAGMLDEIEVRNTPYYDGTDDDGRICIYRVER